MDKNTWQGNMVWFARMPRLIQHHRDIWSRKELIEITHTVTQLCKADLEEWVSLGAINREDLPEALRIQGQLDLALVDLKKHLNRGKKISRGHDPIDWEGLAEIARPLRAKGWEWKKILRHMEAMGIQKLPKTHESLRSNLSRHDLLK